jgi:hypothetical protein
MGIAVVRFAARNGYDLVTSSRRASAAQRKCLIALGWPLSPKGSSPGHQVVAVELADRLARDLMVSEVIIDWLTRSGAKVLTADGAGLMSAEVSQLDR